MTEQQLIMEFYPTNYHDKTISDLVEDLKTIQSNVGYTTEQIQNNLKSDFPNISDWSF
tara:strand:+ start:60 stop:233 length:174 start_codon:yes stop_codon:yes gene_type:complete